MGDVAMTVPVIKAFVNQHPNVKVTFVSKGFLKPLFEDIKNVSFVTAQVNKEHKGFLGLFKLYKELKQLEPTHFADLHNVLRSKIVRSLFKLFSNISVASIDKGRKEKKALTRKTNKVFKQLKTSHQRYADVFSSLGFPVDLQKVPKIEKQSLSTSNISLLGKKDLPWIGIAPLAAFKTKVYPADLMEDLINKLSKKNVHIFLFGSREDSIYLEQIEKQANNTICVAGKLDGLKDELNLISNLDIMISMDSGNAHFAAMMGTKTITLWGSTHPFAGFAPFNQPEEYCMLPNLEKYPLLPCSIYGNKIHPGYEDVMRSISPESVADKVISEIKKDYPNW